MPIIKIEGYECGKCGYRWTRRKETDRRPKICPDCKTVNWE